MKKVLIISGILLLLLAFTATIALAQAGDTAKGKTLWAQNN